MRRLAVLFVLLFATPAAAADFAPVDRPGPPLQFSQAQLDASTSCTPGAATADRPPVLLTAGTTVTTEEDFGWNWVPALKQAGFPVCTVELPTKEGRQNNADIQLRGEYVVNAIRHAYAAGGKRPIGIVGHSQGGQVMRWALRFWPDTRPMVSDVVGMAPTNHGSALVSTLCVPSCSPALWQQIDTSNYYKALNSHQETFAGISYTNVYTRLDQFVQPNQDDTGTSSLHTGDGRITNVAVQDICPTDTSEHLLIGTSDPVASALGFDALTHDGPADPARIDKAVCSQLFMPGVDPSTFATDFAAASARVATELITAQRVDQEPPLQPYVFADYKLSAPAAVPKPAATCSRTSRRVKVGKRAVRARSAGRRLKISNGTVLVRFKDNQRTIKVDIVRRAASGKLVKRTITARRC